MLETREFTRSGERAHVPSLVKALTPLLAVANAGSFHMKQRPGLVSIRQESFAGVDLAAVRAAIEAAPVPDDDTDADDALEDRALKAVMRAAWEHGNAQVTWPQFGARVRELYKEG